MGVWRDDVVAALANLGGQAHLNDIYGEVEKVRAEPLPVSWRDIIRRELEYNSSDSTNFKGNHDLFYSVHGIGMGVWGLRSNRTKEGDVRGSKSGLQIDSRRSFVQLELPGNDLLLTAAGRVALAHGQLEQTLRMTFKTLSNLTVKQALDATAGMKNWELRNEASKLFKQHTVDHVLRAKFRALIGECERLSEQRNTLIHNAWAIAEDGSIVVKSKSHRWTKAPSADDLNGLAEDISDLVIRLNEARLRGFIHEVTEEAFAPKQ